SNFFAALDDSDNEGKAPAPAVATKKTKAPPAPKPEVVEPSKVVNQRPNKDDRKGRGGRGGRGPPRDGKRTHDRRSGTGRGKEIKKGGGGGHNWGSDQNDAKKAEGAVTEGKEDENGMELTETEPVAEEEVEEEEVVEAKEPEPEDNTMSYDEYLAQKSRPDSEAFKPLEERAVDNEFAGKVSAKKETEDFLVMGGGKQPKKKGSGAKKEKDVRGDPMIGVVIVAVDAGMEEGAMMEGAEEEETVVTMDAGKEEVEGMVDGVVIVVDVVIEEAVAVEEDAEAGDWSIRPTLLHFHHFREMCWGTRFLM
ncbi:hypothetical protein ACHAWU_009180, partial [Discostella pseudostelligera]